MKELFKGYYNLDEKDFSILWERAIFIFDTNVLLNLYRYQASTRDALLEVIEKLAQRVWIPYHVGLEFQRNRLTVIAEQYNRFSKVKNIVEEAISTMEKEFEELQLRNRHTHINPDKLIEETKKLASIFFNELNELEKQSININSNDQIRVRLDTLFKDKIGLPPSNQKIIDDISKDGENRYKNSIPPGYKDSSKGDKNPDEFSYGGILYKRKFGDLIIWKQIIKFVEENEHKNIIFITDDNKADWWWKVNSSSGPKTIGVRPELKDELTRQGKVDNFHVYNTESFLRYANSHLGTQVTKETIEEIRDISHDIRNVYDIKEGFVPMVRYAERAVYEWLSIKYSNIEINNNFPDFIAYEDNKKLGFEAKLLRNINNINIMFKNLEYRSYYIMNEENLSELTLILVLLDEDSIYRAEEMIKRRYTEMKSNIKVILGKPNEIKASGEIEGFNPLVYIDLT
ncbi:MULTISPECIES: PIN-like domain-containing protein [Acinetobacter]|uniref:PIN-like domain-containing protein n=1 Tax=Acinetobacter TaxID=469 RepID=UPI00192B9632|nr:MULTISPECIES: PIN domain-containing protein [Acinetobacter]MDS7966024.1 PIN domain-containing protein [Acinetobacter sp. V117_2]